MRAPWTEKAVIDGGEQLDLAESALVEERILGKDSRFGRGVTAVRGPWQGDWATSAGLLPTSLQLTKWGGW